MRATSEEPEASLSEGVDPSQSWELGTAGDSVAVSQSSEEDEVAEDADSTEEEESDTGQEGGDQSGEGGAGGLLQELQQAFRQARTSQRRAILLLAAALSFEGVVLIGASLFSGSDDEVPAEVSASAKHKTERPPPVEKADPEPASEKGGLLSPGEDAFIDSSTRKRMEQQGAL